MGGIARPTAEQDSRDLELVTDHVAATVGDPLERRDPAGADRDLGSRAATAAADHGDVIVAAIDIAAAARDDRDRADAVTDAAIDLDRSADIKHQDVVVAQATVDAARHRQVGAHRQRGGALDPQGVVDQQRLCRREAGAVGQRRGVTRTIDRQPLDRQGPADSDLAAFTLCLHDQRNGQRQTGGATAHRDRVRATRRPEHQGRDAAGRELARINADAARATERDRRRRVGGHDQQASAHRQVCHQAGDVDHALGQRRRRSHQLRTATDDRQPVEGDQRALELDAVADLEVDALCLQACAQDQGLGLDMETGRAEIDQTQALEVGQAHCVADDMDRAQRRVPADLLDAAEQAAGTELDQVLRRRAGQRLELERQAVIGKIAGRIVAQHQRGWRASGGFGVAHVDDDVIGSCRGMDRQRLFMQTQDRQAVGQAAQTDVVERDPGHAQGIAAIGEQLEAARVVAGLQREGFEHLDGGARDAAVDPVVGDDAELARSRQQIRHEQQVASPGQQGRNRLAVAAELRALLRLLRLQPELRALRQRLLGELDPAVAGRDRQRQAGRIGISQRAGRQHDLADPVGGEIETLRQHQVGRGTGRDGTEAIDRPVAGERDQLATGGVERRRTPVGNRRHRLSGQAPGLTTVERAPEAARGATGGGRQHQAVVADRDRAPVGGRSDRAPAPAAHAGIGQVEPAIARGSDQMLTAGVQIGSNPVAIGQRATGLLAPADLAVGRHLAEIDRTRARIVPGVAGDRQQGLAVSGQAERIPVQVGQRLRGPVALVIHQAQLARTALDTGLLDQIPPALAVLDLPALRIVGGQDATIVERDQIDHLFVRHRVADPGQARVARNRQTAAIQRRDDAAAGRDRDGAVAAALRRTGGLPAQAAVAGKIEALLATASRGSRDQPAAALRQIAPGLGRQRRLHPLQLRLGLRQQVALLELDRQRAEVGLRVQAQADMTPGSEIGIEAGERTRDRHLVAAAAADGHAVGRGRLDHASVERHRDSNRRCRIRVPRERRASERDARGFARQKIEYGRDRDQRHARQGADDAKQHWRQAAREIDLGRLQTVFADAVDPQRATEDIAVNASATRQLVDALQRIEDVVAGTATDLVVARPGVQQVVAHAAGELVAATAGHQHHGGGTRAERAQHVVALGIDRLAATGAQQDHIVARAAIGIDRDRRLQARGIKLVIAGAQIDNDLGHATELLVEARELDTDLAAAGPAAQDPVLGDIVGAQVEPVASACARVQGQHAVLDPAQHGLDGRCRQLDLEQLETEDRQVIAREADLGPEIAVDVGRDGEVEQVERTAWNTGDQARVEHHREHLGGTHLAVTTVVDREILAFGVARDVAGLDVVEVGIDPELEAGPQPGLDDVRNADAGLEADLDRETELGLLLPAGARLHDAVIEQRQAPVVDIEAIDQIEPVASRDRLLHTVAVKAEGQVGEHADAAEGIDGEGHRQRNQTTRQQRQGRIGDLDLEVVETEVQVRQLVGEQGRIAAAEYLGPVRDVGQIGHELQARARTQADRAARGQTGQLGHLGVEDIDDRGTARRWRQRSAVAGRERHLVGAQTVQAADREIARLGHDPGQHVGQVERELDRVDEGPVDRRLVGQHGLPDHIDQAAQRRIGRQQQVQAHDRRRQILDHQAEGLDDLGHLLRDRQQELRQRRLQVDANALERHHGQGDRGIAQAPVPVEHEISRQLGQAGHAELDRQIQTGRDAKIDRERPAGCRQHAVERQALRRVTVQVDRELAAQAAALEAVGRIGVLVLVGDAGLEEQQLALARERGDLVAVVGVAIEEGAQRQAELGVVLVAVGGQVEAAAGRQAEAEVELPIGRQREAAVDVQAEARQLERKRNVQTGELQGATQVHVEADRIDAIPRQRHAGPPGRDTHAGGIVETDVDVAQSDVAAGIAAVKQHAQAAEGIEQGLASKFDRLASARELLAQILQQAPAQAGDDLAGLSQASADEGNVGRQAALEQVLHRAQAEVDAVDQRARVIEQVDQQVLAGVGQVEVGQFHRQCRGRTRRRQAGELLHQGRQAVGAQRRIAVHAQQADRDIALQHIGCQRQLQVEGTDQAESRLTVNQRDLQHGRCGGQRIGIGVERDEAVLDAELEHADLEVELELLRDQARRQGQAGATVGRGVVVANRKRDATALTVRQADDQAQLQIGTELEVHAGRAGSVEEAVEAGGQGKPGQRRDLGEVEVERQPVAPVQRQAQIDQQLMLGAVEREVELIVGQTQIALQQRFHLLQTQGRIGDGGLEHAEPVVTKGHQVLERPVDHRQRLVVEGLALRQLIDDADAVAQAREDVADVDLAEVGQRTEIRQDQLEAAQVAEIAHRERDLEIGRQCHRDAAARGGQALDAGIGRSRQVELEAAQAFADELAEGEAGTALDLGRAVEREVEHGVEPQAGAAAGATRLQADEAQANLGSKIADIERQGGLRREMVDRERETALSQVDDQVEAGIEVEVELALGRGRQRKAVTVAQAEVESGFEAERVGEADRNPDIAAGRVVARLLVAQQARSVERLDEFAQGADLDAGLMDAVVALERGRVPAARDGQRAAVGGNRVDAQGLRADRDPQPGHRGGELALGRRELLAAGTGRRAAGRLDARGITGHRRPGQLGLVEVDPVEHAALEGRCQIQHIAQRLLDKGQSGQAKAVDIDGLEVGQQIGQRQDQVLDLDLGEIGKLVEVLGAGLQRAVEQAAGNADLGHQAARSGHVDARERDEDGQLDLDPVAGRIEVEPERTIDIGQAATQRSRQQAVLAIDAMGIGSAQAQVERAQGRAEHDIAGRERALEGQLAQVEARGQAVAPVKREVEIERCAQAGIDLHRAVDRETEAAKRLLQADVEAVDAALERGGDAKGQSLAIHGKTQALTIDQARLRRPVLVQVGLQATQRRQASRAVDRRRQALQTAASRCARSRAQIGQQVVTDVDHRREPQQLVEVLVDQRQSGG